MAVPGRQGGVEQKSGKRRAGEPGPGSSGTAAFVADQTPGRVIQRGDHLCRAGECHEDAYWLRCGYLVSYLSYEDGGEEIVGLHSPGDVVGAEALLGLPAPYSIRATDTAHVQQLPRVNNSAEHGDGSELIKLASEAMHSEVLRLTQLLHLDRMPAEQRLASFLLDFGLRAIGGKRESFDFRLPLTRRELARYLGLAPETLSRTFAALDAKGLVRADNHEISILRLTRLRQLASG